MNSGNVGGCEQTSIRRDDVATELIGRFVIRDTLNKSRVSQIIHDDLSSRDDELSELSLVLSLQIVR